jgi:hypothetical protein
MRGGWRLLALVFVVTAAQPALAHKDRYIGVSPAGELSGLPKRFRPASVEIVRIPVLKVAVTIGRARLRLPGCVASRFSWPAAQDLIVGASWYHDTTVLPPYLIIRLPGSAESRQPKLGSLMIHLGTAALLEVIEPEIDPACDACTRALDLETVCSAEERRQLTPEALH